MEREWECGGGEGLGEGRGGGGPPPTTPPILSIGERGAVVVAVAVVAADVAAAVAAEVGVAAVQKVWQ